METDTSRTGSGNGEWITETDGVYHVEPEPTSQTPLSTTVVSAVASVSGEDPTILPPLYETIDPDALDALFQPASSDTPRSHGRVSFPFAGYDVTVRSTDTIELEPAPPE